MQLVLLQGCCLLLCSVASVRSHHDQRADDYLAGCALLPCRCVQAWRSV